MFQSRTHNCGELRLSDAGKEVTLTGWLENVREVGANFAFLVLRDFYGATQVVVETEDMMQTVKGINKESTISVTGTVRERASKNPKQPTGDIEVAPTAITVLGKCYHNALPFEINKSRDADENARLKYRYLDLRNPAVKENIILRCNVVSAIRAGMTAEGFLEITTPILTSSSPRSIAKPSPLAVVILPSVTTPCMVYSAAPRKSRSKPGKQVAVFPSRKPWRPSTTPGAAQIAAILLPSSSACRSASISGSHAVRFSAPGIPPGRKITSPSEKSVSATVASARIWI